MEAYILGTIYHYLVRVDPEVEAFEKQMEVGVGLLRLRHLAWWIAMGMLVLYHCPYILR